MAITVVMPRQGNTVETCIILGWKKREGDEVKEGETLCEVETDKATFEVESPGEGVVLKVLHPEGAEVPVLAPIAVIGARGESADAALEEARRTGVNGHGATPSGAGGGGAAAAGGDRVIAAGGETGARSTAASAGLMPYGRKARISPRARKLAEAHEFNWEGLSGSGPGGRVIERDVREALERGASPTLAGGATLAHGAAAKGAERVAAAARPAPDAGAGAITEIAVQGVRRRTAERMRESIATTAQLTLNCTADARAFQAYRRKLKEGGAALGLAEVNLNDMIMFAAAKTLSAFPSLNAHFLGDKILQFERVNLAFAVDTPRGLMVPVIRNADLLSLRGLSEEARRLAAACRDAKISREELSGGTFTVTNLGGLGIEQFTPVLNPPQVGILGVGSIALKPVEGAEGVTFVPHLFLSLTIDHQGIDGAPAARFLASLRENVAHFDLLLAG